MQKVAELTLNWEMKVLVFGGNGFIGAETVDALLDSGVVDVTVVNRGRSWDWETTKTIKPRVRCICADRDKPLSEFPELCEHVKDVHHDAVIDFSGYSPVAVKEAIELVTGQCDLYIYVSSDSVYEVCQEKQHIGHSRETDAVRPDDERDRKKARRRDSYGDDKLSAEEIIVEHSSRTGLPYVILRLADVIGPKDSTNRFWQYHLWVEMATSHKDISVLIPKKYEGCPLSFVYSKDVAKLVTKIVNMDKESRTAICNEAYNLACSENIHLVEVIRTIEKSLGLQQSKPYVTFDEGEQVPQIYPSVDRGPVDITKAIDRLHWSPTPLDKAITDTVEFYKGVVKQKLFLGERKDVYKDLKESLEDMFEKQTMKKYLKEILLLS